MIKALISEAFVDHNSWQDQEDPALLPLIPGKTVINWDGRWWEVYGERETDGNKFFYFVVNKGPLLDPLNTPIGKHYPYDEIFHNTRRMLIAPENSVSKKVRENLHKSSLSKVKQNKGKLGIPGGVTDAKTAFEWLRAHRRHPGWETMCNLSDMELLISKDPASSYKYANIFNKRFQRGELAIERDPIYAELYVQLLKSIGINIKYNKEEKRFIYDN